MVLMDQITYTSSFTGSVHGCTMRPVRHRVSCAPGLEYMLSAVTLKDVVRIHMASSVSGFMYHEMNDIAQQTYDLLLFLFIIVGLQVRGVFSCFFLVCY